MEGDKLVLKTLEQYVLPENLLREATTAWDQAFVTCYGHLNDQELNEKEREIGHRDQFPIVGLEIAVQV